MKNLFLMLFAGILFPALACADEVNRAVTSNGNDVYMAGSTVEQYAPVAEDLFLAGEIAELSVNAPVGEDIMVAGGYVRVLSDVADDARLAGYDITVTGKIGDSLIAAGYNVFLRGKSEIGGDAWIAGNTIEINAPIKGDAKLTGRNIILNDRISGNATIEAVDFSVGESGYIEGDLTLIAPRMISRDFFGGQNPIFIRTNFPDSNESYVGKSIRKLTSPKSLFLLSITLLLGGIILFPFQRLWVLFARKGCKSPFVGMGIGFLTLISFPIAFVLLILSVIGIPLGFILLFSFLALSIFVFLIKGLIIGALLLPIDEKTPFLNMYASFVLGTLIIYLLKLLPLNLGCVLSFLIFLAALGTLALVKWEIFGFLRKKKMI